MFPICYTHESCLKNIQNLHYYIYVGTFWKFVAKVKVKLSLCLNKHYTMKTCGGSAPWHWLEVNGQLHTAVALPPGERAPTTLWIGGCLGPTAGLHDTK
jgi:hypothetical protein